MEGKDGAEETQWSRSVCRWKGDGKKSPFLVTVLVMFTETAIVIVPQGIQLLIRKVKKIRRWMVVTAGTTHECTQSH